MAGGPAVMEVDLVASCWTTAGAVTPFASPQLSPHPIGERIAAVAAADYVGLGGSQDDLAVARDTVGFPALRRMIAGAGAAARRGGAAHRSGRCDGAARRRGRTRRRVPEDRLSAR